MKIEFKLTTNEGHVGDFIYDWQCPIIPRIGENIIIKNIFAEGIFNVSNEDFILETIAKKSYMACIEDNVYNHLWIITDITWCKNEEYFLRICLFGE